MKNGSLYSAAYDLDKHHLEPKLSIMIAATPRSGSTYLCMKLWKTGAFGAPLEYLNLARCTDMLPRLGNGNCLDYWNELKRRRTSLNGVFTFKAFISDFEQIARRWHELLPEVRSDKVVYLYRQDEVGQAISFAKAAQTDQWFSISKQRQTPNYSKKAVDFYLNEIRRQNIAWERIFEITGTKPLRIIYEDFIRNPDIEIDRIKSFCGITTNNITVEDLPDLELQRDIITEEWRSRYYSE